MDLSAYQPRNNNQNNTTTPQNNHDTAKIFVGGLSWQSNEETLRYHFEQFGEVVSVEVMRDRNTGNPRGFAFVVFKDDATVDLVMSNLPQEINHKIVDVKRAQAKGSAPPSIHRDATTGGGRYGKHNNHDDDDSSMTSNNTNRGGSSSFHKNNYNKHESSPESLQNKIFVGGLPLHLTKEGFIDFFSQFAPVVDAIIMMDQTQNRSRGFGFVTFQGGSDGAQLAMNAQPLFIDQKKVEVKIAMPKGEQGNDNSGGNTSRYHNSAAAAQGLRNVNAASLAYQSKGEFAGLAASYGRNGWRAGYGTVAFGSYGWNVAGWEDISKAPERSGFSFDLLEKAQQQSSNVNDDKNRKRGNSSLTDKPVERRSKRQRQ